MKLLFLDVDGVLNSAESFHKNHLEREDAIVNGIDEITRRKLYSWPLGHLSTPHIERLNKICDETGCKIVISSTWRKLDDGSLPGWLTQKGFRHADKVVGRTDDFNVSYGRGYEIQEWLNNTTETVDSFAILDDDWDMHHLMPFLIQTSWSEGLDDACVEQTIDLLNGKIESVPNHDRRSKLAEHMTIDVWSKEDSD